MRNLSVTTFIHILFSVAIAILIATFILFISWDRDRSKIEEFKRYQLISVTFLSKLQSYPSEDEIKKLYKDLHVKLVDSKELPSLKKKIQTKGKTLFSGGSSAGRVRVFDIDNMHYINVQRMSYNLMLEDDLPENYYFEIAIASGVTIILVLLLIYLAVLRKLYPLKKLH
jgi:two-component system OmpR family sensor kinase